MTSVPLLFCWEDGRPIQTAPPREKDQRVG
jgi:hypothetical protein